MKIQTALCFISSICSFQALSAWQYPNNARFAISLSFDDARRSQVDVGLPLLDKHKVKGSFYIMPEQMIGYDKAWKMQEKMAMR